MKCGSEGGLRWESRGKVIGGAKAVSIMGGSKATIRVGTRVGVNRIGGSELLGLPPHLRLHLKVKAEYADTPGCLVVCPTPPNQTPNQ